MGVLRRYDSAKDEWSGIPITTKLQKCFRFFMVIPGLKQKDGWWLLNREYHCYENGPYKMYWHRLKDTDVNAEWRISSMMKRNLYTSLPFVAGYGSMYNINDLKATDNAIQLHSEKNGELQFPSPVTGENQKWRVAGSEEMCTLHPRNTDTDA